MEDGEEAEGTEETGEGAEGTEEKGEEGDDGQTWGEVVEEEGMGAVEKEGARVVEGGEGAGEGRRCEEVEREGADVQVVQKPPAEVAATADEGGACTEAPASGAERVEAGLGWGEVGGQEIAGGLEVGCRGGGGEGWEEAMG